MRRIWKMPLFLGVLAFVVGVSAGCNSNPIILIEYLLSDGDPKTDAEYPLKPRPKHEKEEVKVLVMTSCGGSSNADMIGVDRLLATEFIPVLEARCKDNKELVTVLKTQPLADFKRENPDWREMHPMDIGKKFGADYVIDIEVLEFSIIEPRTNQELMRGRSTVCMKAYDMSKSLREPAFRPVDYTFEYPKTHPIDRGEKSPARFRQDFVKKMAFDLVTPFTANTAQDKVSVD